ncbi:hypothetical protein LSAT2_016865 [Lamellibrachia satsuma]|nr:hypothetical protein LSAT2_016865 [Lamellibrachia satsuma]
MINGDKKKPDVQPEDSVSHVSCSSTSRVSSTATTTSSTHARARAAGLAAAAAALETEQCLEREEQTLRQRMELLKLQTDNAIAEAEAKVYEADVAKQSDVNKATAPQSIRKRAPLQLLCVACQQRLLGQAAPMDVNGSTRQPPRCTDEQPELDNPGFELLRQQQHMLQIM